MCQGCLSVEKYWEQCGCKPDDPIEVLKEKLLWGTYGPTWDKHPLKYVPLKDCTTGHLLAILEEREYHKLPVMPQIQQVIDALLTDRGVPLPASSFRTDALFCAKQP